MKDGKYTLQDSGMVMFDTEIVVRTQFRGFHCWPDAPKEVAFLRNEHRHVFHVELRLRVIHANRQLEFFIVQKDIDDAIDYLHSHLSTQTWSCETWARAIIDALFTRSKGAEYYPAIRSCSVFEDGENGAIVTVRSITTFTTPETPQKTPKRGDSRGRKRAARAQRQRSNPERSKGRKALAASIVLT